MSLCMSNMKDHRHKMAHCIVRIRGSAHMQLGYVGASGLDSMWQSSKHATLLSISRLSARGSTLTCSSFCENLPDWKFLGKEPPVRVRHLAGSPESLAEQLVCAGLMLPQKAFCPCWHLSYACTLLQTGSWFAWRQTTTVTTLTTQACCS